MKDWCLIKFKKLFKTIFYIWNNNLEKRNRIDKVKIRGKIRKVIKYDKGYILEVNSKYYINILILKVVSLMLGKY